jgi:hypothetical protein
MVDKEYQMDDLIVRWQRAAHRAQDERVRVLKIGDEYRATSSSHPLGSYRLEQTSEGWTCECLANREYHLPCKHLWALAEMIGLDVLSDTRVDIPPAPVATEAA